MGWEKERDKVKGRGRVKEKEMVREMEKGMGIRLYCRGEVLQYFRLHGSHKP